MIIQKILLWKIHKAFDTCKRIYHNDNDDLFSIPQYFEVPYNDNNWRKEIRCMKLGKITNDIRNKKILIDNKSELI